ncbi:MAG: 2'-5' RNA ligase family protein [Sneathiella sp.]
MKQLYTLAFPKLNQHDQIWVDRTREQNDPDFQKVRPHFTLLFGCGDVSAEVYARHVKNTAKVTPSFEFHARRVSLGIDHFGTGGYVFLVPDEGHSSILALHDRIYSGPLSAHLNLKLSFIPHITLGKLDSLEEAKKITNELNCKAISVSGLIDSITVVEEKDGVVTIQEEFTLSTDD